MKPAVRVAHKNIGISSGDVQTGGPDVTSVTGTRSDGSTLTINGSNFTTKTNAKPWVWWNADDGQNPTSKGRHTTWDDTFTGASSTVQKPSGSTATYRLDHGATTAAFLAQMDYSSNILYVCRKVYEDYDITTDYARRTRYDDTTLTDGPFVVGETVTGGTSGATGIIQSINTAPSPNDEIFYEPTGGTINDPSPVYFSNGETMTGGTSGAAATNSEGAGLLRTFNLKAIRSFADNETWVGDFRNNIHFNLQGIATTQEYDMTPEGSDGTVHDNGIAQNPDEWMIQEFELTQSSAADVEDGLFKMWQKRLAGTNNATTIVTRDSAADNLYAELFQYQVSNGAQPESFSYIDHLYVDDTFHRVMVADESTWSTVTNSHEVQLPSAWSDTQITIECRQGALSAVAGKYLYVFDSTGTVVDENGWLL